MWANHRVVFDRVGDTEIKMVVEQQCIGELFTPILWNIILGVRVLKWLMFSFLYHLFSYFSEQVN